MTELQVAKKRGRPRKSGTERGPYFKWNSNPGLLNTLISLVNEGFDAQQISARKEFEGVPLKVISSKMHNLRRQKAMLDSNTVSSGADNESLSLEDAPSANTAGSSTADQDASTQTSRREAKNCAADRAIAQMFKQLGVLYEKVGDKKDFWYVFIKKLPGINFKVSHSTFDSIAVACSGTKPPRALLQQCPEFQNVCDQETGEEQSVYTLVLAAPFSLKPVETWDIRYYPASASAENAEYSMLKIPAAKPSEINL